MMEETAMSCDAEAWCVLALVLDPVTPSRGIRDRLMARLERSARYLPFCADLMAHFDLSEDRAHALLARIGDPSAWMPGIGKTVALLDFNPGPRLASAHCGVVRMKGGARVPPHRHRERELTLVLEGALVDGEGRRYLPGQALDMAPGSTHALSIVGEPEALLAVLQAEIDVI